MGVAVGVCLSFNNHQSKDGIGAQVVRIIDVYALSRHFNMGFVNSQILQFDSNPGDNLNTPEEKQNFLSELVEFLNLESGSCQKLHQTRQVNNSKLFQLPGALPTYFILRKLLSHVLNRHELLIINNPNSLTLRYPNIRSYFTKVPRVSNFESNYNNAKSLQDRVCRIHVHIRRGLISKNILGNRFVPTEWFLSLLLPIQATLDELEVNCEFTIHTDVHEGNIQWSSTGVSAESMAYLKEGGNKIDEDLKFTLAYEDFNVSLRELKFIKIVTELNPLESWKLMQEADILVIGKSSFSFVGALLNQSAQVISPVGFYSGPSDWTYVADSDELPPSFLKSLQEKYRRPLR